MRPAVVSVALFAAAALLRPQHTIGADVEPVVYHDLAAIPGTPYGPYTSERAVLTDTSSIVVATMPRGYRQPVHHHDQEQFTIALAGSVGYTIGGVHHGLGSHRAALPPSNVPHGLDNSSDATAVFMEYQPVLRREWIPPHPRMPPQPQSAEPAALTADQTVTLDFDRASGGWRVEKDGARVKTLGGKTIRATFWDLATSGAAVDLANPPSGRERLAFVVDGRVTSSVAASRREIGPEMLVEVRSAVKNARLTSLGTGAALVIVFETIPN